MGAPVEGTFIAFAAADNGVADDNLSDKNSLFTKHLLSALPAPHRDPLFESHLRRGRFVAPDRKRALTSKEYVRVTLE